MSENSKILQVYRDITIVLISSKSENAMKLSIIRLHYFTLNFCEMNKISEI